MYSEEVTSVPEDIGVFYLTINNAKKYPCNAPINPTMNDKWSSDG